MEPGPNPWIGASGRPVAEPSTADPTLGAGYQAPLPVQQPAYQPQAYTPQAYPPGYPQGYGPGGGQMITNRADKSVQAAVAWILTVLTLAYLLPWAIAATRGKSNSGAIGVLNFLLGWTFIGWVAALVMACGPHQVVAMAPTVVVQQYAAPPPPVPYRT